MSEPDKNSELILVAQSWRVGVANNTKPWHILGIRADGAGASLLGLCGTETGGQQRAERVTFDAFRIDGTRKRCSRCLWAHRRGGAFTEKAGSHDRA